MKPWTSPGIGWIFAVGALVLVLIHLVGVAMPADAVWWGLGLLALAILL